MPRFTTLHLLFCFFLITACGDDGSPAATTDLSDVAVEDVTLTEEDDADDAGEGPADAEEITPDGSQADGEVEVDPTDAPVEDDSESSTQDTGPEDVETSPEDIDDAGSDSEPTPSDSSVSDGESMADVEEDTSGPQIAPAGPYALLCDVLCDDVLVSCSNYSPFGLDQSSCRATCQELAEDGVPSLIAMSCMAASCDAAACTGVDYGSSFPSLCEEACAAADECGVLGAIQSGYEDLDYYCQLGCSAPLVADTENYTPVVQCVIDTLAESCDPQVFNACFQQIGPGPPPPDEGPDCAMACGYAFEFLCPPWTTDTLPWADMTACTNECEAYEEAGGSSVAFFGCLTGAGCTQASSCSQLPSTLNAGCVAACEKMTSLCGFEVFPSSSYCAQSCSGQIFGQDALVTLDETLSCLEAYDVCPPEDPFAVVFGCASSLELPCASLCANIQGCEGQATTAQGLEECTNACVAGLFSMAGQIDTLNQCTKDNVDDCDAVQACLAGPPPPVCYQLCSPGFMCDAQLESCTATCEAALSDGQSADQACEFATSCGEGACDGLQASSSVEPCKAACASAEETCSGDSTLCEGSCIGLSHGLMLPTEEDAQCIVSSLGSACDLSMALYGCVAPSPPPPLPPG